MPKDFSAKNQTDIWLQSKKITELENPWRLYLECGGFPRAACEKVFLGAIADETFRTYQDWILGAWSKNRVSIQSQMAIARRVMSCLNSRITLESLRKGTDIGSVNTIKELISHQEDRWALRSICRFDWQKKNMAKC